MHKYAQIFCHTPMKENMQTRFHRLHSLARSHTSCFRHNRDHAHTPPALTTLAIISSTLLLKCVVSIHGRWGWAVGACPDGLEHFLSTSKWAISCFKRRGGGRGQNDWQDGLCTFLLKSAMKKNKRAKASFWKPQNSDQLFQYLGKIGRCDIMNLEYDTSEQT